MAFLESPQNAVSNGIAIEAEIGIGGILDPAKTVTTRIVEDLLSADAHQRSNQGTGAQGAFGGHTTRFASGEQLPDPGFRLVVGVMTEGEQIARSEQSAEDRVARPASSLLPVAARSHGHGARFEPHAEIPRHRRAMPGPFG